MPIGYVSRTESFSAAHRLHTPHLSDEKNLQVYGKCNGLHGHNYRVTVTVRGEIDPDTGMIVDLGMLKKVMWERALNLLDHANLENIEYFKVRPSTAENIAVYMWKALCDHVNTMSESAKLYSLRVQETEHNAAEYRGE